MSEHSGSWQEGFDDGYAWCRDAKQMGPFEQGAGLGLRINRTGLMMKNTTPT